jgi:hypothetical protein
MTGALGLGASGERHYPLNVAITLPYSGMTVGSIRSHAHSDCGGRRRQGGAAAEIWASEIVALEQPYSPRRGAGLA